MHRPSVPRPLLLRPPAVLLNLLLLKSYARYPRFWQTAPSSPRRKDWTKFTSGNLAARLASIRASGKSTSAQEAELADLEAVGPEPPLLKLQAVLLNLLLLKLSRKRSQNRAGPNLRAEPRCQTQSLW